MSADERFSAEVEARLTLLVRSVRAARHEIGNVMYPGAGLLDRARAEGPCGSELANRTETLMEMLAEVRVGLDLFREVSRIRSEPYTGRDTELGGWARTFSPFGRAILTRAAFSMGKVDGLTVNSSASAISMVSAAALITMELYLERVGDMAHVNGRPDAAPDHGGQSPRALIAAERRNQAAAADGPAQLVFRLESPHSPMPWPDAARRVVSASGGSSECADGAVVVWWP